MSVEFVLTDIQQDDSTNDDYCSACSGQGELLCCDGCDRSFHFGCLDPPMDISELEGHWYCCMCTTNRLPLSNQPRGLFSTLLHNVEKKNPCVFSLPQGLREYFTGMKTGEDGSYEDLTVPKRQ